MELFGIALVAGFIAQLIDGSLGMGYGIMLSSALYSMGLPPVSVSASVHLAKVVASGVSGFSHWRFGNVDKIVMLKLAGGGIGGAVFGALILTSAPTHLIKPAVAVYLAAMGVLIVYKSLHKTPPREQARWTTRLGLVGGFCDAIGGGGWGAIVTGGLLVKGQNPRLAIGSVSLAEFFVALTIIGLLIQEVPSLLAQMQIIAGLIIGSALAAPLGAYVVGRVSPRPLMFAVGGLILVLSGGTVLSAVLAVI